MPVPRRVSGSICRAAGDPRKILPILHRKTANIEEISNTIVDLNNITSLEHGKTGQENVKDHITGTWKNNSSRLGNGLVKARKLYR
jgi:hypothetical protein